MYMYILAFSCSGYTLIYLAPPPQLISKDSNSIVSMVTGATNLKNAWYSTHRLQNTLLDCLFANLKPTVSLVGPCNTDLCWYYESTIYAN